MTRPARCQAALLLCAALGLVGAPSPAAAALGAVVHVARRNDTPESLAATYYGNRARGIYVREANHLAAPGRLREGQAVRIPTAFKIKVRRGDTLERLARRFLDDARRAPFLGEWNGLKPNDVLPVGAELIVPFHLVHRARAPESLATLAKAFYNDAGQGKLLLAYNFRKAAVLAPGERLVIPVPHVRVRAVWLSSGRGAARAGAPPPRQALPTLGEAQRREEELAHRVATRLHGAEQAWADGGYEDVVDQLNRLLIDEDPSEPQLVLIHRLLGYAYVALGHDDPAIAEFREVLQRDPGAQLDAASVSPKIREVFERARVER